jgi:cation diffusion facilitator family transporter
MAGPASSPQRPTGPVPGPAGAGPGPGGPGASATEPGASATEPGASATEPGASATEPGAPAVGPAVSATEPGASATGPGAAADQPGEAAGPGGAVPKTGALRAVLAALGANLGIAATKFIAFAITGSASMLAEAVHSVADSGNQVLLLLGRNRASRARTEEHPFGYGRERYFYAFVVAVVLFTVGCLFSVYEGIQKITHPEPVRDPAVAFVVLGIAIAAESFSLRTALRESSAQRDGHGWLAFIRRAKAPELPAILLEDMAALTGLFLAAVGVALAVITGHEFWDGVGSLAIGALLASVAVILAVETKSLLIGESASTDVERAIVAALEDGTEVERVIHLRTLHMGPDSLLVAAKIAVRPYDRAETVAAGIDAAERRVRAAVPIARMIYLEPDLYRAGRADATDPSIRAVRRPRRLPRADELIYAMLRREWQARHRLG